MNKTNTVRYDAKETAVKLVTLLQLFDPRSSMPYTRDRVSLTASFLALISVVNVTFGPQLSIYEGCFLSTFH